MKYKEKGYLADSCRIDFKARVREVEPRGGGICAVYLDRTFFYPVSGGQPDDRGTLGGGRVAEVIEDEKGIRHVVEGEFGVGSEVEGHVDWDRRFDHMQQHSGQHLLSRVFIDLAGLHTVSFHLGESTCTIDLDGDIPSEATLEAVESRGNGLIFGSVPITDRVVGREEFDAISRGAAGEDVRSKLPEGVRSVRLVEIAGLDRSTCCGTHCRSTGEIGIIKVLGVERVRGGARVEFVCGRRALKDYAEKHGLLSSIASRLTTDWRGLEGVIERFSEENKLLRKKRDELQRELAGMKAEGLDGPADSLGEFGLVRKVFQESEGASLKEMAFRVRDTGGKIVLFGMRGRVPAMVFACSPEVPLDMGAVMKGSAAVMGARGGGGRDFARGGGGDPGLLDKAMDEAERLIREALE